MEKLYKRLGSKHLRSLVSEEYSSIPPQQASQERAQEVRVLVLERLPLFLQEHTHMKTLIEPDWLAQDNHFQASTSDMVLLANF